MAISIKTVADKTFNLLKGYGFSIDTFNKVGEVVGDPSEAIRFFVEDPNLLVTLNIPDEEIRLSISKNTEQTDKLRKQLENLGKDYLMNLDFRVFGRTLKPSSDSVDVAKETNMKETNELRKLAGLPMKEEEDNFVYASEIVFFDKDGKEIDYLDWDGYDDANSDKSEEELQAIAQKFNIKPEDGKVVGYFNASGTEVRFADEDDEEYPEGTTGVYIDSKNPMGKVKAVEDNEKAYDFEPTPEAEAWYNSIVDHDDLDNMYNQWEEAFSQADTEDKVDVALHHVQGLLADGPLDDYNTLWQAWEQDEDIEDMLPKYQAMAKKSAGTPELPMMGEAEAIKEASLGAVHGSLKTSYQPLDSVKIVVKHSKPVNEEVRGARSRNISKIFIQANEERFLFPSKNLQGARAMARHIYNGGVMHDTVGESIVQMCKDFGTLKEFVRYVNKQGLINEDNQEYVTLARQQMDNIRTSFKRVAGVKTYSKAVESITDESNIDIVTEVNLADHFTETHFDEKVGNAHETLSKLVNRKNAFEQYIMTAIENENFANAKELIQEEPIEFENPHQRLGYQVGQLSSCVQDSKLANYLGGIGNKLSTGGQLDAMEYRAVKASLLSAQRPQQTVMATEMSLAESTKYQKFIESFDVEV